jgi:uncharacterized protein YuzE
MAENDKERKNKMSKTVDYDPKNDILFIHKGFELDEKFKGNIDAGNLILDMSTKGRIRGVEIINAKDFLKEFNITMSLLNDLSDADFEAISKPHSIMISLILKAKQTQKTAKIAVTMAN